ncbi:dipeptidyl aminopeptidase/acylaminoacyl peptidase [Natronospira proteinivora]|uniref:Dipeptidyl aminopeptidase/acylaminoacyl peptidase n=1 Tax=Natronospira proteinivora TaxID=1807133 RepID=A0ABT1G7M4_9GAMM|nr:S9 family peptidase [Natronospira proteinivora]MCP1727295.1 dipeptidyl aminopeptidase/acylaminoacyl peptidase [Natronospira proteinivora]
MLSILSKLLIALLLVLAVSGALADDKPDGLTPEDYYDFQFISDPQMAPDGGKVAFVRATVSDDRESRESAIWLVGTDGETEPRRFTRGDSDSQPRWSPDGQSLAFVSGRDDSTQLYVMPVDGGEAQAVTEIEQGSIAGFEWLPGGEGFLLTLNLDPAVDDPTQEKEEDETPEADVTLIDRAVYKTESAGLLDDSRLGLWRLDRESGELDALLQPSDWQVHNARVSPDGEVVAFNADRDGGEFDGDFNQDLYLLTLEDGDVRRLDTPEGRSEMAAFSPDGRDLIFHHHNDRYEPTQIHRLDIASGDRAQWHDGMDLSVGNLLWAGDQPHFQADYRGSRPIFHLSDEGNDWRMLLGEAASISGLSLSEDGRRMAYTLEDEVSLAEVYVADGDGDNPRRLTRFNDELLAERSLLPLERFEFSTDGDFKLDGFLLRPVGFEAGQRYPVILNIKGGPGGMWGHQWFHEKQMMAAKGYAVIFTNYRGSSGYGHAFSDAVRLDYGGVDFRDNMQLVDEALARHDWMDEDRLYVTGGSHGGFLTNWITTQTDRFRAAVTQRSVASWLSEAGTQAFPPKFMAAEFGGNLWENFDYYWSRSPLRYADQVTTPTYIIHSDQDQITPIGQGQEWYYALLNNEVETGMAIFHGEGHGLSRAGKPVNLVKRLQLILDWFERYE